MKLLVIGIDKGSPEFLFEDDRLSNIRHLMSFGCFGFLEGTGNLQNGLEWLCITTGQERIEVEHPYGATIWEQIEKQGKNAIVIYKPPGTSHPKKILETFNEDFEWKDAVEDTGESVDFDQFIGSVYAKSRGEFDRVQQLLHSEPWDYFQFVDTGLERLYRAIGDGSDETDQETIRNYYLHFDEQIGAIFEMLDEDTSILILVAHRISEPAGSFILAGANLSISGFVEGVNPIDIAPTLLELGGYEIPDTMQGKSILSGQLIDTEGMTLNEDEEAILRERLSGLGYF